jgi:Skp family chaperone for outer membrane proteins
MEKSFITQAQMTQRKGRAGRTKPGVCYHLYTPQQYDEAIKGLQMEIQSKQKEYETKVKSGASQAQLELLQKSYERLVQEYQETEQIGNREIQAQRGNLLKPIVDEIKKAVGEVAAKKGYSSVIDNATGMVIWSANANDDITDAVIKYMLKIK